MELLELMSELNEHNKTERGYQIHLNTGNLDDGSRKNTGIEFCDLYFTQCMTLRNSKLLCFDNSNRKPDRKPVGEKEDGTKLYPQESNSSLMIDIKRIEAIERVDNPNDWFEFSSEKIINIYMLPEDASLNGHRNVVSVGFME